MSIVQGDVTRMVANTSSVACSVGIMAYNEEANIAAAIRTIFNQRLVGCHIDELIVVASGCEDRTVEVVSGIAHDDRRVRVIEQERREGKASAINLFIGAARSPILVMVSADVLLEDGALDALLRHFEDPEIGMVGGHPIPVNDETSFIGHAVHLQWRLHDRLARRAPKLGEMVAFRNVVPSIPTDTAVDEISIQALITQLGYRLVYEPGAVVYNRGPATLADFLRQRRRIYAGHLRVCEQQAYAASTMSTGPILRALIGSGSFSTPRAALWSLGTVGLEATARGLGRYDVLRRRPQHVWDIATTTKRDIAEGAHAHRAQNVLVFRIVDFDRRQLELGAHAGRQLTQRVTQSMKRALGPQAIVSAQGGGTIVAFLPGDRQAAERSARELVDRFETTPLPVARHGDASAIRLACGIVAFAQPGPPVARSLPIRTVEAELAASTVG